MSEQKELRVRIDEDLHAWLKEEFPDQGQATTVTRHLLLVLQEAMLVGRTSLIKGSILTDPYELMLKHKIHGYIGTSKAFDLRPTREGSRRSNQED